VDQDTNNTNNGNKCMRREKMYEQRRKGRAVRGHTSTKHHSSLRQVSLCCFGVQMDEYPVLLGI
jgi:hypothetical protein